MKSNKTPPTPPSTYEKINQQQRSIPPPLPDTLEHTIRIIRPPPQTPLLITPQRSSRPLPPLTKLRILVTPTGSMITIPHMIPKPRALKAGIVLLPKPGSNLAEPRDVGHIRGIERRAAVKVGEDAGFVDGAGEGGVGF